MAETARQGDAISAAQGLPSGKYDYTHMSAGQLMTVRANMAENLGMSSDQLSAMWSVGLQKADGGTLFGSSIGWTTPRNFLGELTRDRDRLAGTNDFLNAKLYNAAILAMKNTSVIAAGAAHSHLYAQARATSEFSDSVDRKPTRVTGLIFQLTSILPN
jgi:hypothetical protein